MLHYFRKLEHDMVSSNFSKIPFDPKCRICSTGIGVLYYLATLKHFPRVVFTRFVNKFFKTTLVTVAYFGHT